MISWVLSNAIFQMLCLCSVSFFHSIEAKEECTCSHTAYDGYHEQELLYVRTIASEKKSYLLKVSECQKNYS